jgi:hypothetical protein
MIPRIDAAIREIKKAAIEDGKNIEDAIPAFQDPCNEAPHY